MRRILSLSLAMMLILSLFAGCAAPSATTTAATSKADATTSAATAAPGTTAGSTTAAPAATTANASKLSGEITMWHSFTQGTRFDVINAAAAAFMKENPNVKITIQTFSWGDFYTKWTTGLASGSVPDLSTALPNHVAEMVDAEAIVPLNSLVDSIGRNRFSQAALTEGTVGGKNYSIPLYSHAQVLWYRKDLLAKAGLQVPKTWDELYETAKALTKDGIYGLSVPTGKGDLMGARFLNFYMKSRGESPLTKDKKANLTSQIALDGINYWVKMYKATSPKDSVNYKVLDQATLFYKGQTAFDMNSGFHISGVITNSPALADQIDCTYLPRYKADDPIYGGETSNIPMVIWKKSKNPAVAEAFVKYLYQTDRYIDFLFATPVGQLPALNDIATNPKYTANATVQKYANAAKVIADAVSKGTAIGFENGPSVEAGLITSQGVIEGMFQDILVNGTDVKAAATAAEKKLNELFASVK